VLVEHTSYPVAHPNLAGLPAILVYLDHGTVATVAVDRLRAVLADSAAGAVVLAAAEVMYPSCTAADWRAWGHRYLDVCDACGFTPFFAPGVAAAAALVGCALAEAAQVQNAGGENDGTLDGVIDALENAQTALAGRA